MVGSALFAKVEKFRWVNHISLIKNIANTHILVELCDILQQEHIKKFGDDKAVDQLLSTQYIFIDLRDFHHPGISMDEWLQRVLLTCFLSLPNTTEQTIAYWTCQPILAWSVTTLVLEFMKTTKQRFFFHFDEVDHIKQVSPPITSGDFSVEVVKRYYDFWVAIQPILRSGNFIYCSGRSSILYSLGRGWFQSIGLISNMLALVMFHTFKLNFVV